MNTVYFLHSPTVDSDLYQGRRLVYACDLITADDLAFHHPLDFLDCLTHHDLLKLRDEIQGSQPIVAASGYPLMVTPQEWRDLLSGKTLVPPGEFLRVMDNDVWDPAAWDELASGYDG